MVVMLSDTEIADLYAWLYTDLPPPKGMWDHVFPIDGAYAAIKRINGIDYVLFRGSVSTIDWLEDFFKVAVPIPDFYLGYVHPGFVLSIRAIQDRRKSGGGEKVGIVGHSLGAGHAQIFAGLRVVKNLPVDKIVLFGSPRAGGPTLSGVLSKLKIISYRNAEPKGHDLVTDIPVAFPPVINYQHPVMLTDIFAEPDINDKWLVFKYHHFGLYCRALKANGQAAKSLPGYLLKDTNNG